jgi:hypothetical protein
MIRIALALLMTGIAPAIAADPPSLPPGITCELVRAKVAEHGKIVAFAWAKLNGYSRAEIDAAKRCLR